jgi:hypothetical protein
MCWYAEQYFNRGGACTSNGLQSLSGIATVTVPGSTWTDFD